MATPRLLFSLCVAFLWTAAYSQEVEASDLTGTYAARWIASKGGTMPGAGGAGAPANGDATATSPVTNPQGTESVGGSAPETSPEPTNISAGTATPPVSSQGQTNPNRGN